MGKKKQEAAKPSAGKKQTKKTKSISVLLLLDFANSSGSFKEHYTTML